MAVGAATGPWLRTPASARVPEPVDALVTRWWRDRWARGSYSTVAVGASRATRAELTFAVLSDRIVLAGEACQPRLPRARSMARYCLGSTCGQAARQPARLVGLTSSSSAQVLRGLRQRAACSRPATGSRSSRPGTGSAAASAPDRSWGLPVELGAAWLHGLRRNPVRRSSRTPSCGLFRTRWGTSMVRRPDGSSGSRPRRSDRAYEQHVADHRRGPAAPVRRPALRWRERLSAKGFPRDAVEAVRSSTWEIEHEYADDAAHLDLAWFDQGRVRARR